MKPTNIDNTIREKLQNRTLQPSASAWERLAVQLDEQPKNTKKSWLFYSSIAAGILLLISLGVNLFLSKDSEIKPTQEIVIQPIDTNDVNNSFENKINKNQPENAIVQQTEIQKNTISDKVTSTQKSNFKKQHTEFKINNSENSLAKITVDESLENGIEIVKNPSKNTEKITISGTSTSIKINSEDLLYAVTHTPKEVEAYYAKYQVDREDVLRFIKKELKQSNIKLNPDIILAEVEKSIDEEDFKNNFMQFLKKRVEDIASVIATRND